MATKLKGLEIESVDLVDQGANQDAHVLLFKQKEKGAESSWRLPRNLRSLTENLPKKFTDSLRKTFTKGEDAETFGEKIGERNKEQQNRRLLEEMWEYSQALTGSFTSIICEADMSEEEKRNMMFQSLDEFVSAKRSAIPIWASGVPIKPEDVEKADTDKSEESDDDPEETEKQKLEEEETDTMKLDRNKMSPEDATQLEALEKKYGAPASAGEVVEAEVHPEVKKALDANKKLTEEMEAIKKNLEVEQLKSIAKKYEVLGKNSSELAEKLYDLKKAASTHYDDYLAVLDEQVNLVEKSMLFGEVGSNRSGSIGADAIEKKAEEIQKSQNISYSEAIVKAYEENPELAAQYENSLYGGNK